MDKILVIAEGPCPQYVKTFDNPADVASRGLSVKRKKEAKMWAKGPPFLRQLSESWKFDLNPPKVNEETVQAEMACRPVRLNHMQVSDSRNHLLETPAQSSSAMEAEKSLVKLSQCFFALHPGRSADVA